VNPSDSAPVPASEGAGAPALDALLDVSMPVIIEIGRTTMTLQEVLQLGPGSIVSLDRAVGEPVDIFVGDRRLAQGEIVVVNDHLAVRVTRVLSAGPDAA
jgi:flagellar motor switch protein FliN/FliY